MGFEEVTIDNLYDPGGSSTAIMQPGLEKFENRLQYEN